MTLRALLLPTLLLTLTACGDEKSDGGDDSAASTDGGGDGTDGTDGGDDGDDGGDDGDDGGDDGGDAGGDDGVEEPVDADEDGFLSDVDCDDADPAVHPEATEWVDGVDNDCDPATTEDGMATWWGSAGPVDATGSVTVGWEAPEDGTLALGSGTWAATLTVPAGLVVEVVGHGGATVQSMDEDVVVNHGELTLRTLTVEGHTVEGKLGSTLHIDTVDFGTTALWLFQGTTTDIVGITMRGDRGISAITQGGEPPAARTLVLDQGDIEVATYGIQGIENLTVRNSSIFGVQRGISAMETGTVDNCTLGSDSTAVELGRSSGDLASDLTITNSVLVGYLGVFLQSGSHLDLQDSEVAGENAALMVLGDSVSVARSQLSSATGTVVTLSGAVAASFSEVEFLGVRHLIGQGAPVVTLEDSLLVGATGRSVGLTTSAAATSTFARNTFQNNADSHTGSGFGGNGGALFCDGADHSWVLEDNVFDGNTSAKYGGAVYLRQGTAALSGNSFTGNASAQSGGALALDTSLAGFSSTGDSFTGNTATGSGGAVTSLVAAHFTDVVMQNNAAGYAGGAVAGPLLELSGTWDLGTGSTDNTPDDFFWLAGGGTTTIESGTGTLSCGDGVLSCVAL